MDAADLNSDPRKSLQLAENEQDISEASYSFWKTVITIASIALRKRLLVMNSKCSLKKIKTKCLQLWKPLLWYSN